MALLQDVLGWFCVLAGSLIVLVGSLGLLRLPDLFSRLHGAGMTDTLGAGLLVAGMLVHVTDWLIAVKLILIVAFLGITSPTTSHALARAALHGGLRPWTKNAADGKEEP
jgi:multicomponent Na+:H+ antiporter subunit G